ncbi:MAG TPA: hypothetical protein VKT80_15755, partial [Chloroflexota bacterium]|nr:hypothetical protein [Chloroflexota bacterium]
MKAYRNPIPTLAAVPGRFVRWIPEHPVRSGIAVAILGIVLVVGAPLANITLAGAHLYRARDISRSSGPGSSGLSQIPEVHRELVTAVGDLERAQVELAALSPGFRMLGLIPGLGWLRSTPDLVGLGAASLGAGSDVVGSLEPVGPSSDSRWRALVGALQSHRDQLVLAQAQLDRAMFFRQRVDRGAYSGLVSPIGKSLDDFDRYLPMARTGLDLLK